MTRNVVERLSKYITPRFCPKLYFHLYLKSIKFNEVSIFTHKTYFGLIDIKTVPFIRLQTEILNKSLSL